MNKKLKVTIISVLMFSAMWISDEIIFRIIGNSPNNIYISDYFLFLNPLLIIIVLSTYFLIRKKKDIAIGIIIGGFIYYLVSWFNISWDLSEMSCQRYFFNLFITNCPRMPGIK